VYHAYLPKSSIGCYYGPTPPPNFLYRSYSYKAGGGGDEGGGGGGGDEGRNNISIEDEAYEIAYLQPVTGRHPGTTIKQEFVPNNLCEKETERTGEGREVEGR